MPASRNGLYLRVIWQKSIEYEIVFLSHTSLLFIREENNYCITKNAIKTINNMVPVKKLLPLLNCCYLLTLLWFVIARSVALVLVVPESLSIIPMILWAWVFCYEKKKLLCILIIFVIIHVWDPFTKIISRRYNSYHHPRQ